MYDSPSMMPPPVMGQPIGVINIDAGMIGTPCPVCGHIGPSIPRYTMGCAAWSWCCVLFWTTYLCWIIPVCSNGCKDVEQLCDRCGAVKGILPGTCC